MTDLQETTSTMRRADERREPLRRCIATGESRPREALLRFVVGPDDVLVPDVAGRLPGRGLWLTARRDMMEVARSKKLFARAARCAVRAPDGLADQVEALLARRCLELIGLARRAEAAVAGFEVVRDWLRRGRVGILLTASDAAEEGARKLQRAAAGIPAMRLFSAAELGQAFGRDLAVHAAVAKGRLAERILVESARLEGFRAAPPGSETSGPGDAGRRQGTEKADRND